MQAEVRKRNGENASLFDAKRNLFIFAVVIIHQKLTQEHEHEEITHRIAAERIAADTEQTV